VITPEEVQKIARLAHLEFDADGIEQMSTELSAILDYVEALQELDTSGVEPTSHAVPTAMRLREDMVDARLTREEVLQNAPAQSEGQFQVPKVVAS